MLIIYLKNKQNKTYIKLLTVLQSLQNFSKTKQTAQHYKELAIFQNYRRFLADLVCDVITTCI